MPKSKQQKQATVHDLVAELKTAKGVVFANFQGLTVAQSEDLRKTAREQGVTVSAAKKTLVKRALDEAGLSGIDLSVFKGGIATFVGSDEITPAKIVSTFAKKNTIVTIFGGILDGKFIDQAMVKTLSALPGKQELLSMMVRSMNAPISGFVNASAGIMRGLLNVLSAYKDKKAV